MSTSAVASISELESMIMEGVVFRILSRTVKPRLFEDANGDKTIAVMRVSAMQDIRNEWRSSFDSEMKKASTSPLAAAKKTIQETMSAPAYSEMLMPYSNSMFDAEYRNIMEGVHGINSRGNDNRPNYKMVPVSPLDPDYRNRECTFKAGSNQLMFAALPAELDEGAMSKLLVRCRNNCADQAVRSIQIAVGRWDDPSAAQVTSSGFLGYVGAGFYGAEDDPSSKSLKAFIATTADAIGLSALWFELADPDLYWSFVSAVTSPWNKLINDPSSAKYWKYSDATRSKMGAFNAPADLTGIEAVEAAMRDTREVFLSRSIPMVREAIEHGYDVSFVPGAKEGKLSMSFDGLAMSCEILKAPCSNPDNKVLLSREDRLCYTGKIDSPGRDCHSLALCHATSGRLISTGKQEGHLLPDEYIQVLNNTEAYLALERRCLGITQPESIELPGSIKVGSAHDAFRIGGRSDNASFVLSHLITTDCSLGKVLILDKAQSDNSIRRNPPSRVTRSKTEQHCIGYDDNGMPFCYEVEMVADESGNMVAKTDENRMPQLMKQSDGNPKPLMRVAANGALEVARPNDRTAEDAVRGAVHAAREHFRSAFNLAELIEASRIFNDHPATASIPSFDCNGALPEPIATWREDIWLMLTKKKDLLKKPGSNTGGYQLAEGSYADGTLEPELIEFDHPLEGACDTHHLIDREAYAQKFEDYALACYLGTFDLAYDDFAGALPISTAFGGRHRFHIGHIVAFQPAAMGIADRERFAAAIKRCGITPGELIAPSADDDNSTIALLDSITPFDESSAKSLADLTKITKSTDASMADRYCVSLLRIVKSKIAELSVFTTDVYDDEIEIDATGLVRYKVPSYDGRGSRRPAKTLHTGYIGRFAIPDNTFGALRTASPNKSDNSILYQSNRARILPMSATEGDRVQRTRIKKFDEYLAESIRAELNHDIEMLFLSAQSGKAQEFGSYSSMAGIYNANWIKAKRSAAEYDERLARARAFANGANASECADSRNPLPDAALEVLRAEELTRLSEVRYPDIYAKVTNVTSRPRPLVGTEQLYADTRKDAFALADYRNMVEMNEAEKAAFDPCWASDTTDQPLKRGLNAGVTILTDGCLNTKLSHGRSPIGELVPYIDNDAWNRGFMAEKNIASALSVGTAWVASLGGGGWLQDDGIVVSRQWAKAHRIKGANNRVREPRIGDKLSDAHGNKGVISMIIDTDLSYDEALAQRDSEDPVYGDSWYEMWRLFKENTSNDENCSLDAVMNNVSFMTRQNAGALLERLESEHRTLIVPGSDGKTKTEVPDGIANIVFIQHNKLADANNLANDSHTGWQMAYANIDDCPALMAELYAFNESGWKRVRENLNIAFGADLTNDGQLHASISSLEGDERSVIELAYVEHSQSVEGETCLPIPGVLDIEQSVDATMKALPAGGGALRIPFALKWPRKSCSANKLSASQCADLDIDPRDGSVSIGGAKLAPAGTTDCFGNPLYDMPLPSSAGIASLSDGADLAYDDSIVYRRIIMHAAKYVSARNECAAYAEEANRLNACFERFAQDPCDPSGLDPQAAPKAALGTLLVNDKDRPKTNKELADRYNQLAHSSGSNKNKAARTPWAIQSSAAASAQYLFTKLAQKAAARFMGKDSIIKNHIMRARIRRSAYCIWSANPDLPLDTIAIGSEIARSIGITEEDKGNASLRVLLWRAPILRKSNNLAVKFVVTDLIDGVMVHPALAKSIGGDFDGDRISIFLPRDPEVQDEMRAQRSLERNLLDVDHGIVSKARATRVESEDGEKVHTEWTGGIVGPSDKAKRPVDEYGLAINDGLDAQLGLVAGNFTAEDRKHLYDVLRHAKYRACKAYKEYERTVAAAKRETSVPADASDAERDAAKESLEKQSRIALEKRDSECRAAIALIDKYLHQIVPRSVARFPLQATSTQTILNSLIDATLNARVKGKPEQAASLMFYMGLIPSDETAREVVHACAAVGAKNEAVIGDIRTTLVGWLNSNPFRDLQEPNEQGRYAVSSENYCSIDDVRSGQIPWLSDDESQVLTEAWDDVKAHRDNSVRVAMNCKTAITGIVGSLPQRLHLALPGLHNEVCAITEPMYQMSLDFKLDGADAMAKIPWVDMWIGVLQNGNVYKDLDTTEGIPADASPEQFEPLSVWQPGKNLPDGGASVVATPDKIRHQLYNIYQRVEQPVDHGAIDRIVFALTNTVTAPKKEGGEMKVSYVMPLSTFAQNNASTLAALAFDTSKDLASLAWATSASARLCGGKRIADQEVSCMMPGRVRRTIGIECPTANQRRQFADAATLLPSRSRATERQKKTINSRGIKHAIGTGSIRVALLGFSQEICLDDLCDQIDTALKKAGIDTGLNGAELHAVTPDDGVETVEHAFESMASKADLIVLVGNGTTSGVTMRVGNMSVYASESEILNTASSLGTMLIEINLAPVRQGDLLPLGIDSDDDMVIRSEVFPFQDDSFANDYRDAAKMNSGSRAASRSVLNAIASGKLSIAVSGLRPESDLLCKDRDFKKLYKAPKVPEGCKPFSPRNDHAAPGREDKHATELIVDYQHIQQEVSNVLEALLEQTDLASGGSLEIITGASSGGGYLAFSAGRLLRKKGNYSSRIDLVVEKPFENAEGMWSTDSSCNFFNRSRYKDMIETDGAIVREPPQVISPKTGRELPMRYSNGASGMKQRLSERDKRMVEQADILLVVATPERVKNKSVDITDAIDFAHSAGKDIIYVDSTSPRARKAEGRADDPVVTVSFTTCGAFL